MANEACPICGEEADADKIDSHGHFSSDDEGDDEGMVHLVIDGTRKDKLACGDDPDQHTWSPENGDVNCSTCRAAM